VKRTILPLSLILALVSCSQEATVAAKEAVGKAGEAAKSAVNTLTEKFGNIDWSKLAPDKLKEMGGELVSTVATKLSEIKDSDTAKSIASHVTPLLEKAGSSLKALGDKLPGRADIKLKVDELRAKYANDEGIMSHLKPVLDKLSEILG